MKKTNEKLFHKDFFLEIIQEIDSYSARKFFNLYVFLVDTSIYKLKKSICNINIEDESFIIILQTVEKEYIYKSEATDKSDKKIYKFLKKYIEIENIDYNIIISNLSDVFKYENMDFFKLEIFKNKIEKKQKGCKYEF